MPKKADEPAALEGRETSEAAEDFFRKAEPRDRAASEALEEGVTRYARRQPTWRSPTLLVLIVGVSGWLLFSMWDDLSYFLTEATPADLGDIEEYDLSRASENSFVRIEGLPHQLQAQYKQLGRRYRVYPLIGTRVFVREPLSEAGAEEDGYPSFSGEGRLLDIRKERTYANVRAFYQERGRYNFSEPAWILLVDVTPRKLWWVPVAYVALGVILLLNLTLLARRFVARGR